MTRTATSIGCSSLARPDARRSPGSHGRRHPPGRRGDAAGAAAVATPPLEVHSDVPHSDRDRRGGIVVACRRACSSPVRLGPERVLAATEPDHLAKRYARPVSGERRRLDPDRLRAEWMGDHRDLVAPDAGTTIIFDGAHLCPHPIQRQGCPPTGLECVECRRRADPPPSRRRRPMAARRAMSVSIDGRCRRAAEPLTITEEGDACGARAGAVAGTWWLMGCTIADDGCLGLLDAGTYKSQYIAPHVDPGAEWSPVFGGLTFTVPAGWANAADWPETFDLVPGSRAARQPRRRHRPLEAGQLDDSANRDGPGSGLLRSGRTWRRPDRRTPSQPHPRHCPGIGHDRTEGDHHRRASRPLGRHPPRSAWKSTCPEEARPVVAFLNPGVAISNVERERLILVDLGGGRHRDCGVDPRSGVLR